MEKILGETELLEEEEDRNFFFYSFDDLNQYICWLLMHDQILTKSGELQFLDKNYESVNERVHIICSICC